MRSRTVEREWETNLRAESPESGRCSVAVGASGATWVRRLPRHPTKVRVGTRSAFYAERVWPNGGGAMLWWEYADAALVIIECGNLTAPRKVLPKLGSRVALAVEPILLPYRVRSVPRHYQVTSVGKGLVSHSTVVPGSQRLSRGHACRSASATQRACRCTGWYSSLVSRYTNGRYTAVCRPFGNSHICVRGELSTPDRINIAAQRGASRWSIGSPGTSSLPRARPTSLAGSTPGKPCRPERSHQVSVCDQRRSRQPDR